MTPIEQLLAEQEIQRLVIAYALANDDGDWDALAATLTEDCRYTRPSGGEAVAGRDAIRASYAARPPRLSRHVISNIFVTFESDESATCRSTFRMLIGLRKCGEIRLAATTRTARATMRPNPRGRLRNVGREEVVADICFVSARLSCGWRNA